MQIIVLGMHRSGTSLVTRMVNMMGAYAGPEGSMLDFTQDNPKGYWERKDVVKCNIFLLKLHDVDWAGYNPATWPMPHHLRDVPPALEHSIKTLIFNMDAHRPWVMKDPRLCLTLPYWKNLLEVPVCVIVHRDPLEIVDSLNRAHHTRVTMSQKRGVALWEFYATALLNASAALPRLFVSHADFLNDPVSATARLYHGLTAHGVQGLRLPANREITAFIDPALHRSKPQARDNQAHAFTGYQRELLAMMHGDDPPQAELAVSEESMKLLLQPVPVTHP